MGLKSALSKVFAAAVNRQLNRLRKNAIALQQNTFSDLIDAAKDTVFGREHNFAEINNYKDFKQNVPIHDYEDLRPYIDRVVNGEENIL